MARKSACVIGLDFGKSVVKMVEYSRVKKQVLTIAKLFLEPSEWDDEAGLSKKMRQWILDKKQSKTGEIVTAVPGEYAVIRQVEVDADEKNIRDTLSWEMEQYINSSLDQYLLDFQDQEGDTAGTTNTFIVSAYRKAEIEKLQRIIDLPSLPLTVVDVDVFASQNAFEINYPEHHSKNTWLIKADLHGINCILTRRGRFLNFHSIPVPDDFLVADDPGRVQIIGDLIKEICTVLEEERSGDQGSVKKFFCGDLAADFEFKQALESAIPSGAVPLNSFKQVRFPHDAEYADKVMETAPQCATALGLAMRYRGDA
ncbi:type IV pilus biogenesis protein PilM [Fibrobacterota bacterium]